MKYCVSCGTKLRDEAFFCYRCGAACARTGSEVPPEAAEEPKQAENVWNPNTAERVEPVISDEAGNPADAEENTVSAGSGSFSRNAGEGPADAEEPTESETDDEETEKSETEDDDTEVIVLPKRTEEDLNHVFIDEIEEEDEEDEDDEDEAEEDDEEEYVDPDEDFDDRMAVRREKVHQRVRRRKRRTVALVTFIVLVTGISSYVAFSPARRTYQAVLAGNSSEAAAVYNSNVKKNPFEKQVLKILTATGSKWIFDSYNGGKMNYDKAAAVLMDLGNYSDTAFWKMNQLETLKTSKDAYREGLDDLSSGNYRDAIGSLSCVLEEDHNYKDAASKLETAESLYCESVLADVSSFKKASDYPSALSLLAEASTVLPGNVTIDSSLKDTRLEYASSLKKESVPIVNSYIDDGYYKEAIDLLKNALAYNSDDDELKALLNTAVTDYENFVTDQVSIYVSNKDYDGAMTLLSRALSDIPDNQKFIDLYKSVKKSKKAQK